MKTFLLILLAAWPAMAQTNRFTFSELLSTNGTCLMTNAEFRLVVGSRLFFQSGELERGYPAAMLHTNVLARLGVTLEQLEALQARHDAMWKQAQADNQVIQAAHLAQIQSELAARAKAQQAAGDSNAAAIKQMQEGAIYIPATDIGTLLLQGASR